MDGKLSMRKAPESLAQSIVDLRDSLARWQEERAIAQWSPGEVEVDDVLEQLARGEWWIDATGGKLRAAVRIAETDELIWPGADNTAGYIHGLMVSRDATGVGLGSRILSWAEQEIAGRGRSVARLDCVATNTTLRTFYLDRGFEERGIKSFESGLDWHPVMRFEKSLTP